MKILIIDNGTNYLLKLKKLLAVHDFQVVEYSQVGTVNPNDFDAIILSGGHDFPVSGNVKRLKREIDLIRNSVKPIFGICFGFELIAYVFGGKLELMENKKSGVLDIQVIEPDEIFSNISQFQVFESHRWTVSSVSDDLLVLARSKYGIEAIKHKSRPIYGVQFHPEMFIEETCGDEIFSNFLNSI